MFVMRGMNPNADALYFTMCYHNAQTHRHDTYLDYDSGAWIETVQAAELLKAEPLSRIVSCPWVGVAQRAIKISLLLDSFIS